MKGDNTKLRFEEQIERMRVEFSAKCRELEETRIKLAQVQEQLKETERLKVS